MAQSPTNKGASEIVGSYDWVGKTIKIMALNNFTTDVDTNIFITDISSNEITGTVGNGYTAGGQILSGKSKSLDLTNNQYLFKAANPSWTPTTSMTAQKFAIYDFTTGVLGTSPILAIIDKGTPQVRTAPELFTLELEGGNAMAFPIVIE